MGYGTMQRATNLLWSWSGTGWEADDRKGLGRRSQRGAVLRRAACANSFTVSGLHEGLPRD